MGAVWGSASGPSGLTAAGLSTPPPTGWYTSNDERSSAPWPVAPAAAAAAAIATAGGRVSGTTGTFNENYGVDVRERGF